MYYSIMLSQKLSPAYHCETTFADFYKIYFLSVDWIMALNVILTDRYDMQVQWL